MRTIHEHETLFLRRQMERMLIGIINNTENQLSGFAELHWTKADSGIGTECLLEYSST